MPMDVEEGEVRSSVHALKGMYSFPGLTLKLQPLMCITLTKSL